MRVLILGATGFIGSAIVRQLLDRGESVIGLARSDAAAQALAAAGCKVAMGDLHDHDAVIAAASGADAVINVAADLEDMPISEPQLATMLIEALQDSDKTLVWTSGVLVTGPSGTQAADESAPLILEGPLGWRARAEAMVLNASEPDGLRTTCVRPPIVYSEQGGAVVGTLTAAAAGADAVPYPGDGSARWATVHVDDLAELYLLALDHGQRGAAYIGASENTIQIKDLAAAVSRRHGLEGRTTAASVDELRARIGPFADMLCLRAVFSGARARSELGWAPSRPSIEQTLGG